MGFGGVRQGAEIALVVAFVVLAVYTYTSGLRAPAMIAFVKDTMIYVFVIAAVIVVPAKLGGYGAVFAAADRAFAAKGGNAGVLLQPGQAMPFASLALGSALALFLYPHAATGMLAASNANTLRRNAIVLPIYSIMLGLIALMGYMAIAANVPAKGTAVVPALIAQSFPEWFAGFCYAAIALGALVPAAIMSIGAANLVTRNIWRPFVERDMSARRESTGAQGTSLAAQFGALAFVVFLPLEYAINLQLLGGIWIAQILPAIAFGLFTRWFRGGALLAGWALGMVLGTALSASVGMKPVFALPEIGGVYIGLIALAANIAVAAALTAVANARGHAPARDATSSDDYEDAPARA
ncbi:MAG: sodium:solute symporter, partial [Deltaproteobacteria bacterium]